MLIESKALAIPLDLWTTYAAAYPIQSRAGQQVELLARGSGTNDMYVMEVDPTTGALPVNIVSGSLVLGYDTNYGVVGADTLRTAAQIGNATGAADFGSGAVSAQTLRTVSILSNASGVIDFSAGNYSAQTVRVVVATDQPAIPVSGTITVDDPSVGPTGDPVPAEATYLGAQNGGDLIGVAADASGNLIVVGAGVAGTPAGGVVTIQGDAAGDPVPISGSVTGTFDGNITEFGSNPVVTGTGTSGVGIPRVTVASDSSLSATNFPATVSTDYGAVGASTIRTAAQVGNATGAADFNAGAAGAQTLRVVQASNSPQGAGRIYSDSAYLSYASSNVTSGAWVEVDASTAAAFNALTLFSSCAEVLELGIGAAAAESRVMLIPPGGVDGQFELIIAAGTRLSVRSVSGGTCSTGNLTLTGYL